MDSQETTMSEVERTLTLERLTRALEVLHHGTFLVLRRMKELAYTFGSREDREDLLEQYFNAVAAAETDAPGITFLLSADWVHNRWTPLYCPPGASTWREGEAREITLEDLREWVREAHDTSYGAVAASVDFAYDATDLADAHAQFKALERSAAAAGRVREAAIRTAVAGGRSMYSIAKELGLSESRISQIVKEA